MIFYMYLASKTCNCYTYGYSRTMVGYQWCRVFGHPGLHSFLLLHQRICERIGRHILDEVLPIQRMTCLISTVCLNIKYTPVWDKSIYVLLSQTKMVKGIIVIEFDAFHINPSQHYIANYFCLLFNGFDNSVFTIANISNPN